MPTPTVVGLPNPASAYCEEQGYVAEMRTDASGGQYGVCVFPNRSECDEWAYYRGECGPDTGAEEAPMMEQPAPTGGLPVTGWLGYVASTPYGGCQLVVTHLRAGQAFTEPEPVEAWEGLVVSNPPGAQFDDYFILAGDFPVGFGISSLDPAVAAQLESLRDTGVTARVWGQLRTGVPDAYGSQIEVTRVEGVGAPLAPTPAP